MRTKPPDGTVFHFDASDPDTYQLDDQGRVRAILGPDGKPVLIQQDSETRPRIIDWTLHFGEETK